MKKILKAILMMNRVRKARKAAKPSFGAASGPRPLMRFRARRRLRRIA